MGLPENIGRIFRTTFGADPLYIARAPGRVNLLGEHVDYNDGFVMPAAIDRATYVAFRPSDSDLSVIVAADFNRETSSFEVKGLKSKPSNTGPVPGGWARYPAGVAWSLTEQGTSIAGIQAVFASEVPRGAGLSSSASVELAFAVAWTSLNARQLSPLELALVCQRAENEYVGVHSGIMDQFASACGETDRVLFLDCRSLEYELLPIPSEAVIVIADTTVRRALMNSAYNDRRASCERAVELLKQKLPGIRALRDVSPPDFNKVSSSLPPEVELRARHVVEEIARTRSAAALLREGDLSGFGLLMNASHESLRDLYEVEAETQIRPPIYLCRASAGAALQ